MRQARISAASGVLLLAALVGGHAAVLQGSATDPAIATAAVQSQQTLPPGDLRMHLHHFLSEHTALAGITTQKAATGAPDFQAAWDHLDQNSMLFSQFIGSIYGPQAAAEFLPTWRAHTQMYVDYTLATDRGDAAMRDQVRNALGQWIRTQAAQIAALNPALPIDTVAAELTTHVNGTLAAIDTFAQGDYNQHYDVMHQAFEHSFMMGDVLAMAIAQQFPDRYALQR
jgi:hypothetical protein